jgi:hypothetical protein
MPVVKAALNEKKTLFTSKLHLNLGKKLVKCYIWGIILCGAKIWTLRKVDQKFLKSSEMCWRRLKNIIWTGHMRHEVLHRVKEERSILHTIKRMKADWIGYIFRRNCLLKHVIEEKIE